MLEPVTIMRMKEFMDFRNEIPVRANLGRPCPLLETAIPGDCKCRRNPWRLAVRDKSALAQPCKVERLTINSLESTVQQVPEAVRRILFKSRRGTMDQ